VPQDIVVREAHVEDAITGNNLRIKDQTLHISTATEEQDNARTIPPEWNVTDVRDLVKLFLIPCRRVASTDGKRAPPPCARRHGAGRRSRSKRTLLSPVFRSPGRIFGSHSTQPVRRALARSHSPL